MPRHLAQLIARVLQRAPQADDFPDVSRHGILPAGDNCGGVQLANAIAAHKKLAKNDGIDSIETISLQDFLMTP